MTCSIPPTERDNVICSIRLMGPHQCWAFHPADIDARALHSSWQDGARLQLTPQSSETPLTALPSARWIRRDTCSLLACSLMIAEQGPCLGLAVQRGRYSAARSDPVPSPPQRSHRRTSHALATRDMSRCHLALTAGDVIQLAGEHGAGYLVTNGRYPFPVSSEPGATPGIA